MTATLDPTYAAMLAPILAHPDEDCWRLQMADWFAENGDEARASFICVQCKLAATECSSKCNLHAAGTRGTGCVCTRNALRLRERELHGKWPSSEWMSHMKDGAYWDYSRGFIASVTCTWSDCCAHLDAILAENPIETVTLTTYVTLPVFVRTTENILLWLRRRWPRIKTWNLSK